jgi:hypothetical protein
MSVYQDEYRPQLWKMSLNEWEEAVRWINLPALEVPPRSAREGRLLLHPIAIQHHHLLRLSSLHHAPSHPPHCLHNLPHLFSHTHIHSPTLPSSATRQWQLAKLCPGNLVFLSSSDDGKFNRSNYTIETKIWLRDSNTEFHTTDKLILTI